jgi:hypothetical protein
LPYVFEKDMAEIMGNDQSSSKEGNAGAGRSHISGTPTIAELRRRVWVRSQPKEKASKAGKKSGASK